MAYRKSLKGKTLEQAIAELEQLHIEADAPVSDFLRDGAYCDDPPDVATARLGVEHGMSRTMAWMVAEHQDDDLYSCTPEERYERMLAYVRNAIVEAEKPPPQRSKEERLSEPTRAEKRAATLARQGQGELLT